MSLIITTSPNIAVLDFTLNPNLCDGKFYLDVVPTVYIGSGALLVEGASFKIVNPSGVTIRDFTTSGYDISGGSPAMQEDVEFNIPTQAGNYQYGTYLVTVRMTDEDGTEYELEKPVKVCVPDSKHVQRNYGTLSATLSGICKEGKLYVVVDTPPNYNGKVVESQVNDFTIYYPSDAQDSEDTTLSSFSVQLYEGEYKLQGEICATYNYGDNVYVNVRYTVKRVKSIKCIIDECCVFGKLAELHRGLSEKCTAAEIQKLSNTTLDTLRLLKTAQLAAECGEDASDYITDLEDLLGCSCTCNCLDGTPLINTDPAKDFVITGCNVTKTTVGLTDSYVIENYEYEVSVNANGGVLTVVSTTLNGCIQTTVLNFNITPLYNQLKTLASADYLSWAAIMNKAWTGLDTSCLGYTTQQWNLLSYVQRSQAIFNAFCTGGVCNAEIENDETEVNANDVTISWNEVTGVFSVDIYMDDILKGTVLAGLEEFTIVGAADGNAHTYSVISKCGNGVIGNALDGSFNYYGCPTIAPPTITITSETDADCPYDLTAIVNALPSGIEAEWHNLNNTSASSLVPDDTNASSGTYYVFAKDSNGCFSLGVRFILSCSVDTGCSAPQSLIVESITDGFRVRFISAAYPPPSNSYTVKRKPAASADVDGSYTTIGTPTYNAGVARWEILDETAVDNTLYTYKAISNCTSSSPSILYEFANISCPTVTLNPSDSDVAYSFAPIGGDIDMYVIEMYNSAGTTRITYDTHTPAFSNPTTGTLLYADPGTTYKVRAKVYIGDYEMICPFQSVTTDAHNYRLSASYGMSIDNVSGSNAPSLPATGVNGTETGVQTGLTGDYTITITGATTPGTIMVALVNDATMDCVDVAAGAGDYVLNISAISSDDVEITIVLGSCA